MGVQRGMKYNGAIDRLKIEPEQTHIINDGQGILKVHDLFAEIPSFFKDADYVVVDPPYNDSAMKSYYTKAEIDDLKTANQLFDRIFEVMAKIGVHACYMECSTKIKDDLAHRMKRIFDNVRIIDSFYYKTKPCAFVIGENEGHELVLDSQPKDELLVIEEIISKKQGTVLDFCLGRGAVSRNALKYGRRFIGTELNINRLAVSLEDLKKMGAEIRSE